VAEAPSIPEVASDAVGPAGLPSSMCGEFGKLAKTNNTMILACLTEPISEAQWQPITKTMEKRQTP